MRKRAYYFRRIYKGINESNADWRWFKTFKYYPKDTMLNIKKNNLIDYKKNKSSKSKIKLVFYETNELIRNYFSKIR